jgi:hypothetical protein
MGNNSSLGYKPIWMLLNMDAPRVLTKPRPSGYGTILPNLDQADMVSLQVHVNDHNVGTWISLL